MIIIFDFLSKMMLLFKQSIIVRRNICNVETEIYHIVSFLLVLTYQLKKKSLHVHKI